MLPPPHPRRRGLFLVLGPLLGLIVGGVCVATGLDPAAGWTAGVTTLCAVWWVTEPIAVPATSMLPFVLLPAAGVLDHKQVAQAYGHHLILLLLGGFMLSAAMERSGAHRRIAVGMVRLVGGGGRRLVLGFMLASALCSMWISNTATVLMLLPVVSAVMGRDDQGEAGLRAPLLLGVAYAASIGGMATPVGTPPNVIFMGVYREAVGEEIAFAEWMAVGLPAALALVPIAWLWLTRGMGAAPAPPLPALQPWQPAERRVLAVFAVTAAAWVFRKAPFGGWSGLLGADTVGDSTVALGAVCAMFLIPNGRGAPLLDWPTARKIPWGLLLLFGGGIAIANAFTASGLADALGRWLADDLGITAWPVLAMTLGICLAVTFLTEVTSNTATTTLLMPVLAAAALAAGVAPAALMVPATLSASCAFMLPVATAPNAVIFGTGGVSTSRMAREGFALNLVGAVVITAVCALLL